MAIFKTYHKVVRAFPDPDYLYMENLYAGNNIFTLTKAGTPNSTDLQYSLDKSTWNNFDLTLGTNTVTVPQGGKIYLRSTTGFSNGTSNYFKLNMSQSFSAGGNIASIFDYENMDTFTAIPNFGCYNMFRSCSSLTTAPDMSNVTTIGNKGCYAMFNNCSQLTTAPDLSNITSIDVNGCENMFYGCSSLTTAPDMSNVTTIGNNGCSYMFSGCSSLNYVTAPNISSWNTTNFTSWLYNVAATGVVAKPASLTIPTDSTSGIPTGWTTVNY